MRPNAKPNSSALYECFVCGSRTASSSAETCESCGGELRNLGVARDL